MNECQKCHTIGQWNLSGLDTCPACVRDWVSEYKSHHRRAPNRAYVINTYADGFGRWHSEISFSPALGNTGDAERTAANAMAAAKRNIRRAIVERMTPKQTRRLSYEVTANEFTPGLGTLRRLVISEH
jgi:hypothetical protein